MNQAANKDINSLSNKVVDKICRAYSKTELPLDAKAIDKLIEQTPSWDYLSENKVLLRRFMFKNYYQTIDFVNKLAEICHEQDHHPVLNVQYGSCEVTFNTHTVKGVTENDFICAARIDRIV